MKNLFLAASVAVALMAAAPAANATQSIHVTPVGADGSLTGTFESNGIAATSAQDPFFENVFDWDLPTGGSMSATLSSIFSSRQGDINFTLVQLNGHAFDIMSTGVFESRFLQDLVVRSGPQQLVIRGTSGGNGSYSGTLSFAAGVGVPEPASWALMIMGFGGIGATLRGKRRSALAA